MVQALVWAAENFAIINIFQKIKEKLEKNSWKDGRILPDNWNAQKRIIVNSRLENTVSLIKDLQGGFRMRLYIEDG